MTNKTGKYISYFMLFLLTLYYTYLHDINLYYNSLIFIMIDLYNLYKIISNNSFRLTIYMDEKCLTQLSFVNHLKSDNIRGYKK